MWTEDFPVVVVCAKGQGCQPGCTPWKEESAQHTNEASEVPSLRGNMDRAQLDSTHLPVCRGRPPSFAICADGMSCCGTGTHTPECYYEEYNECCQPEGSDFSVLCAKGQGCAQTDNHVP